jgi:hypothetical protein
MAAYSALRVSVFDILKCQTAFLAVEMEKYLGARPFHKVFKTMRTDHWDALALG